MSATKQNRHQARTVALQTLYQIDMQRGPGQASIAEFAAPLIAEAELEAPAAEYARRIAAGTWAAYERYDGMIAGVAANWDVSRMAVVDRNILRLAIHELLEQPDVPARVVIDEAIELGREFGDAETPQFINGVLDAIYKQHPACRVARGELPG